MLDKARDSDNDGLGKRRNVNAGYNMYGRLQLQLINKCDNVAKRNRNWVRLVVQMEKLKFTFACVLVHLSAILQTART